MIKRLLITIGLVLALATPVHSLGNLPETLPEASEWQGSSREYLMMRVYAILGKLQMLFEACPKYTEMNDAQKAYCDKLVKELKFWLNQLGEIGEC